MTVGVKDLIDVSGMPTTYGSPRFRNHIARTTAPAISSLERRRAIVIGKTNSIVIWSAFLTVFDVCDEALGSVILRDGRVYLQLSNMQIHGRFDVRSTGGSAVVAV